MVLDEYAVVNVRGAYRRWINMSFHALGKTMSSFLSDPKTRKTVVNKTPWSLLRRDNCDRLGYDFTVPMSLVSHKATLYVFLVLIFVGITCNMLGLRVFLSKQMRNTSTHIYLIVLAVSDSLYLLFLFLSRVLEAIRCLYFPKSKMDIYNHSKAGCLSLQYFMDLWSDYSACLILAFTIERFVACYHAVFFRHRCTPLNARLICAAIFVIQAISIGPHHFMYMKFFEHFQICSIDIKYEEHFTILYICEAVAFRIVPVILVAILNIFIIIKVWVMVRKRRLLRRSIRLSQTSEMSGPEVRTLDKHTQITFMLIIISSCYIITYIPVFIYFMLQKMIANKNEYTEQFVIYCNFSRCLYTFGHSINFFLYTSTAEAFRKQLKVVLCPFHTEPQGYAPVQDPCKRTSAL